METIKSHLLSQHKNIIHGYSTRKDGNSIYGNNLAFHVNDDERLVQKNHRSFSRYLEYPLENLVHMNQVHGDKVMIIEREHQFDKIATCDAIITNKKNVPLMVMVADCIPILIYDPVQEVIAAVHAGRAGTFNKITTKTVMRMRENYGTDVKDIEIVLGPSIGQCCYEVGKEIKEKADRLGLDYAIRTENCRYYLDLISIIQKELDAIGCIQENIEVSPYCTACHTNTFYSYRAEQNRCGRFAGVIMMK